MMAKLSVDEILDAIKELSIIEAADLSKKIEEEFGIQAAVPMAVGSAGGQGGGAPEEEAEEQVEFDVDVARVKGILDHYPSTVAAASFDQIVSDPQVGAVVVATPVETHARLATQALEAGKSVLVEKPLAISSRDARALVELARTRDLLVMAGHTYLFSPPEPAGK